MKKKAFWAKDDCYYTRLGIEKNTAIWEDGMRSTGDRGTYEWWYTDTEYSNGTKIVLIFYSKDHLDVKGPSNPTVQIDVTLPKEKTISVAFSEGKGKLIDASKEKCDVNIGESSIKYIDGKYHLKFSHNDVEYSCVMDPLLPMWRPGTGYLYFGEEEKNYFAWFVAVPSANAKATLKINGKTYNLEGNGYHDHNWGNIGINNVINHWYWCRGNIGPYTVIACDIISEKKYDYTRVPVMLISKDGVIIDDNEENTVIERSKTEQHPITNKFIDNKLTYFQKTDSNTSYEISFERNSDIMVGNLLELIGLSKFKICLAKFIGLNPTYIRCIGNVKLTVSKNGQVETFENEALWEQMFFGNNKDAIINN